MTRSRNQSTARPPGTNARPITRALLLRLGLYWGTLIVFAVGSCTLTFWILASTTGLFSLGAGELFSIRAIGLVALALGGAGIFFIVGALRRVDLPVREMLDGAERVAGGDYSVAIAERGPRELRTLARAFNRMSAQLQTKDSERRALIANIANELRTPLTMLQENIEGLLDGNFARDDAHMNLILGETLRLTHLVDELRMLALAQSGGLILQREITDLAAVVNKTLETFHRDASARNVGLHAVSPGQVVRVNADPGRIQEALGNLIAHALYSNLRSDIRVEIGEPASADHHGPDFARVEVAYRGAPIKNQDFSAYFDRFWGQAAIRADTSDGGLELAIAKLLIQAHGGDISISSEARRGTQIVFTLPLAKNLE